MVYISSWAEFAEQAEELVRNDILRARYSLKYVTKGDAKILLKITDDRTVLQFRTDQQADVKKIVDFVAKLFPLFASGKDAVEDSASQPETHKPAAASAAATTAPVPNARRGAGSGSQGRGRKTTRTKG